MDIKEIRIENLKLLLEVECLGDRMALAKRLGKDDVNHLNQLLTGHGSFGSRVARGIESKLGKPKGWMEVRQGGTFSGDEQVADLASRLMAIPEERRKKLLRAIQQVLDL